MSKYDKLYTLVSNVYVYVDGEHVEQFIFSVEVDGIYTKFSVIGDAMKDSVVRMIEEEIDLDVIKGYIAL